VNRTVIDVDHIERIEPGPEAWELASATHDALIELLDGLAPAEWERPTVCEPWTVADMVGHLIGAAESHASVREGLRQQLWAQRHKGEFGGSDLDAWTGLHVREHADLTSTARLERLREIAPRAVRGRARFPRLLRRVPVSLPDAGSLPAGSPQRVTLGELNTVIFTRDVWLHRVDISRATGWDVRLDPAVDGRIIEDVVADWAARHGRPFQLQLSGPAGGSYRCGRGGPELDLDAVEFAWILSGRGEPDPGAPGAELLRTRVLF
jgi:uncharacterized protein (TIGR03083 family)